MPPSATEWLYNLLRANSTNNWFIICTLTLYILLTEFLCHAKCFNNLTIEWIMECLCIYLFLFYFKNFLASIQLSAGSPNASFFDFFRWKYIIFFFRYLKTGVYWCVFKVIYWSLRKLSSSMFVCIKRRWLLYQFWAELNWFA